MIKIEDSKQTQDFDNNLLDITPRWFLNFISENNLQFRQQICVQWWYNVNIFSIINNSSCICPGNQEYINGSCSCPGDQLLKNNTCTCPWDGQILKENNCVCPVELILKDKECICPENETMINSNCIRTANDILDIDTFLGDQNLDNDKYTSEFFNCSKQYYFKVIETVLEIMPHPFS